MGNGVGRNPHAPSGGRFRPGPPGGAVGIAPYHPSSPHMALSTPIVRAAPEGGGGGLARKGNFSPPPHQRRTTIKIKPNRGKAAFDSPLLSPVFNTPQKTPRVPPKSPPPSPPIVPPSTPIPLRGPIPPHSPFAFHWEK